MKKHIPNIMTLGNLTCGLLAIMYAFSDTPWVGAYFIFGGLFLDFFDGFFARLLKVDGELGKQLDSLADLVTFGVAPGMLMFRTMTWLLMVISNHFNGILRFDDWKEIYFYLDELALIVLIVPVLSALRLARFNISTNQSDQFIGLPTPANAIFVSSVSIISYDLMLADTCSVDGLFYIYFILMILSVTFSLLLNANLPLIALKFKTFGWKGNEVRFIFLGLCLVTILVALLISNVFVAIPIIILLYLIVSIINNSTKRKDEVQSKH